MKLIKRIVSVVILALSISIANSTKSHPISTLINAKFSITPVQLEISEYLSDLSNQKFWLFVDELRNIDELENDLARYKAALDIADKHLSDAQMKLLKLSLSLRSLTPRIQSHLMIADDILSRGDCDDGSTAFVIAGNEIFCSLSELKKKSLDDSSINSDLYSFDHIYPGSENNVQVVVLYGEIGSRSFSEFHNYLKTEVQKGAIKYVMRHFVRHRSATKVRLSGYGVELHLKSTEYKAQDDSPRKDNEETFEAESDVIEVEGFDFKKLKEVHPHLSHSLDKMRASLLEKNEEITALKAWEFQELGLQAAERVASIQGEEALSILQFTAQNFPTQVCLFNFILIYSINSQSFVVGQNSNSHQSQRRLQS